MELKAKLRVMQHQFDQMKEEIVMKEAAVHKERAEKNTLENAREDIEGQLEKVNVIFLSKVLNRSPLDLRLIFMEMDSLIELDNSLPDLSASPQVMMRLRLREFGRRSDAFKKVSALSSTNLIDRIAAAKLV